MAKASPSTDVATKTDASTALELPAGMSLAGIADDAGEFTQQFEKGDLATPFLRVLQSLSPQLQKQKPEFIPGAEQGDFILTSTSRIIKGDQGVLVVPVHFEKSHTEWKPNRGGFVADHGPAFDVDRNATWDEGANTFILRNGNELAVGMLYYVYVVDPETGATESAAFILSGSQMKKGRKWNSVMRSFQLKGPKGYFTPPSFFLSYLVTTVPESNAQGSWYGVSIKSDKFTHQLPDGPDLYDRAKEFYRNVQSGTIKVQMDASEGATAPAADEELPDLPDSDGSFGEDRAF